MRFNILFFLIGIALCQSASAQKINDVFNPNVPIVWLGLDFTTTIFIGDREALGSESDVRTLMAKWNTLMVTEKEKFDISKMLSKINTDYRVDVAKEHNSKLELTNIFSELSNDRARLKSENIQEIIDSYNLSGLQGIGLMFNVENFNKYDLEAVIWVTFIDLDTKSILFTERMLSKPVGFGIRNYWAGAIYSLMKRIKASTFEQWKKKYSSKSTK